MKVAIIGAGQIGTRHLQALALFRNKLEIYVVDPSEESLKLAQDRYNEIKQHYTHKVNYCKSVNEIPGNLFLAIVSTTSKVRRQIIEELLNVSKINYLLLEKFLFTKYDDYFAIEKLLKSKNIITYVNCPRRLWPFYQSLKLQLQDEEILEYHVSGSNLGIGCNAIHFIDQILYFTQEKSIKLFHDFLDDKINESKRKGFVEFTGSLLGKTPKGTKFFMSSYREGKIPLVISIVTNKSRYIIEEISGKAYFCSENNDWKWKEISFEYIYQSKLTNIVLQQLIENGECDLVTYKESQSMHLECLNVFMEHIQKVKNEKVDECLIT